MKKVKEMTARILRKSKLLIEQPDRWGQGFSKRKLGGRLVYCATGAIDAGTAKTSGAGTSAYLNAIYLLHSALPKRHQNKGVACYNDSPRRTHKQIMALFDRAIKKADLDIKKGRSGSQRVESRK